MTPGRGAHTHIATLAITAVRYSVYLCSKKSDCLSNWIPDTQIGGRKTEENISNTIHLKAAAGIHGTRIYYSNLIFPVYYCFTENIRVKCKYAWNNFIIFIQLDMKKLIAVYELCPCELVVPEIACPPNSTRSVHFSQTIQILPLQQHILSWGLFSQCFHFIKAALKI